MSKYGVFSGPYYPVFGHTCVSGSKKCLLFGKFDVLCFLETPASRFALCLINELINSIPKESLNYSE